MKRFPLLVVALLAATGMSGCGSSEATLKGKVVNGDKPVGSEKQQVSVNFHALKPDGSVVTDNAYIAQLNEDGSFQFVASGGTLPPGKYKVAIIIAGSGGREGGGPGPEGFKADKDKKKATDRFAPHNTLPTTKIVKTISAGANEIVIDLSKPEG